MSLPEIFLLLLGLAVVGGCVALGLWLGGRTRRAYNQGAVAHNAALQEVSARSGLRLLPAAPYEHPMLGRQEGWARLEGVLEGLLVELSAPSDEDRMTTWLTVRPPAGQLRAPEQGRRLRLGSSRARAALAGVLGEGRAIDLERLAGRFERLTLDPARAIFVLRPPPRSWHLPREVATESRPEALLDALAQAAALVHALHAPATV